MSRTGIIDADGNFILDDDIPQGKYCPAGKCECKKYSHNETRCDFCEIKSGHYDGINDEWETCPWPSRQVKVEPKTANADITLSWHEPMTSKQAGHYHLTAGFVAVELYRASFAAGYNRALDDAVKAVGKTKAEYDGNFSDVFADMETAISALVKA